ncbi:Rhodanese-related sulfurtransferase [Orbilia oligospora]|uniref:Ribosome biogenesis regulatory protein n=2 Tax=Orbilia oligospora TaxID=2813651 RepID=A0A7C8N9X1_ORBOL|nr:Rhodanese-related sulfurtransferase [Orbilia oligospora]KAF3102327.1 Rhodanese-related sulfurtransferase [Orbilia oligospora]KAF3107217.1 Rhodanese-related sulfurtransferase [Orbilia oligospora]KAF3146598.1 Rhodanese-related sulfurtransferase [Orbilia oligospora]KAF3154121.1 Rhodanese-related sulfurtransferase [Orbilia oligospora]
MSTEMEVDEPQRLPVTVTKPIPLTYDLGHLTAFDSNPLPPLTPSTLEQTLHSTARDATQLLINQILTTVPLKSTQDGVYATLPEPITNLPREKPVPKAKELTTWEKFAKKKGIAAKAKDGKMVYDEATGEWVPKWGYKGSNKGGEDDWAVEVDERKQQDVNANPRSLSRAERVERVRKNEKQQRKNEKNAAATSSSGSGGYKNRRR